MMKPEIDFDVCFAAVSCPAHLRVKRALGNLRTVRDQVDYETADVGP
jgi:hypothetical protein